MNRTIPIDTGYQELLEKSIDYFLETGDFGKAFLLANSAIEFFTFGDFVNQQKATHFLNKMDPFVVNIPFDSTLMHYLTLSGEVNVYNNRPYDAIDIFNSIIDSCRDNHDTLITNFGYAHLKLAEIFSSQWNILEADRYFRKAAVIFEANKDTTMYLWALSGQVTLFSNNGLYHEADELSQKIFSLGASSGNWQVVVVAHLSLALNYLDREIPRIQYTHLKEAKKYLDYPSDIGTYTSTLTYTFFTLYFSIQQNVDSTDYYYNNLLELYEPEKHGAWFEQYLQMARAYRSKVHHHYSQTVRLTNELIKDTRSINKLNYLTRLYRLLVDTYSQANQKLHAYDALLMLNHFQDSLRSIQINNQFLYYNQLFETKKKDNQIVQQEASIQILAAENKLLFWRGLWILFTISGLFLIIYLIRSYRFSRHTSRLQHEFSQNLIKEQENERLRISQDLHDGISQDLILIKNTLDLADEREVADMVSETLQQIRQVSRTLYPVTLKNFGIQAALKELIKKMDNSLDDMEVNFLIDDCKKRLTHQQELHIYRIVQEATTNILKYAECSKVVVRLLNTDSGCELHIEDDGVGIDLDSPTFRKGVGWNSMEERVKILRGTLCINSEKMKGTKIHVKIPEK